MPGDGAMRASHQEREATVQVLREAYEAGRLDLDELRTRAGAAYQARTWSDLRSLTADLPVWPAIPGWYSPQAPGPPSRPGPRPERSHPPVLVMVILIALLGIGAGGWWPALLILVFMLPALAAGTPRDRRAAAGPPRRRP